MYRNLHPFGCDCAGCRDEGRPQVRPYEPLEDPRPRQLTEPPRQDADSSASPEGSDELTDDIAVSDIEGLGCFEGEDDGEVDDPDEVGALFGPTALPEPDENPVAYSERTLMDQLFGPPGQTVDDPLTPYVRRSMCEPLVHGPYSLYAFECHGAESSLACKGLAVFEQGALVTIAILQPDVPPHRVYLDQGRIMLIERRLKPTDVWVAVDHEAWLGLVKAVAEDEGVVFQDASEADLERALAFRLL